MGLTLQPGDRVCTVDTIQPEHVVRAWLSGACSDSLDSLEVGKPWQELSSDQLGWVSDWPEWAMADLAWALAGSGDGCGGYSRQTFANQSVQTDNAPTPQTEEYWPREYRYEYRYGSGDGRGYGYGYGLQAITDRGCGDGSGSGEKYWRLMG